MKDRNIKNWLAKYGCIVLGLIGALAMQSTAQAGYYNVTYTYSGSSSTGQTPTYSSPLFVFQVSTNHQTSGTLWATLIIQANFTWVSGGPGDNPPASIQVEEWASSGLDVTGTSLGNAQLSTPWVSDPVTVNSNTSTDIYEDRSTPVLGPHTATKLSPGTSFVGTQRTVSVSVMGSNFGGTAYVHYQSATH